jgi:hypothetical protein
VVCLGPIDSDKDHPTSPPLEICREPEEIGAKLIDQCSRHVIPPVVSSPRRPMGARSGHRARRHS